MIADSISAHKPFPDYEEIIFQILDEGAAGRVVERHGDGAHRGDDVDRPGVLQPDERPDAQPGGEKRQHALRNQHQAAAVDGVCQHAAE